MSTIHEVSEPAAKRPRLESLSADVSVAFASDQSSSTEIVEASADVQHTASDATATTSAPVVDLSAISSCFSFEGETGLFGDLQGRLGLRPTIESEVGITEYIDPSVAAISGIIKHRFTDFLVFEVGLDGETVRLKNMGYPQPGASVNLAAVEPVAPVSETVASNTEIKVEEVETAAPMAIVDQPLWNPTSEDIMSNHLSPELLDDFKSFVLAGPPNRPAEFRRKAPTAVPSKSAEVTPAWSKTRTSFHSAVIHSKEARTAFHKALRENFAGKLSSEMKESENGNQIIEVKWNSKGTYTRGVGKQAPRPPRPSTDHLPPFIHFTLQKTNREMHDALSGLCRILHVQNREMGTAGTKDKRAITVQRVSMKRGNRTLSQVYNAAKGGSGATRGRGRGGFHGSTGEPGVKIGDLEYKDFGFDLGMLKGNKFVITLRDVQADSPEAINQAVESLRARGFINYYGMQRFGTAPIPTHAIGLALLRSNWALATNLILRKRGGEADDTTDSRIAFFDDQDVEKAMKLMPRRCVAEKAILEHYFYSKNTSDHLSALTRIPKNLRLMYVHGWQSYIWNIVVSERVRLFGCDGPVVGDLVYVIGSGSSETLEDGGTMDVDGDVVETLDPVLDVDDMTEDVQFISEEPAAATPVSRAPKARALTEQDIASKKYSIFDVVLPLPGYSIIYPEGALGDRYKEIMKEDGLDWTNLFRKQKEYSLGGTYRKIFHLPSEVTHRLIPYSDPSIDLAQSDEDILLRRKLPNPIVEGAPLSLALQIELTLGSSTYATMALRELLKSRTSSAHQRALTESMALRLAESVPAALVVRSATEEAVEEEEREARMDLARVEAEM